MTESARWPNPNTCPHTKARATGSGRFCFSCGIEVNADNTPRWRIIRKAAPSPPVELPPEDSEQ